MDEDQAMHWWLRSRKLVLKALRRGFDSLYFLIGWFLWKQCNAHTFDQTTMSASVLAVSILDEVAYWSSAGNRWLGALLA